MLKSLLAAATIAFCVATNASAEDKSKGNEVGTAAVNPTTEQKIEKPEQQLEEVETKAISMWCFATDNGHRIKITASNSENRNVSCDSRCYYKDGSGYNGVLSCSGTVPAKANQVTFCDRYSSNTTYTVTNSGSNSCR